MKQLRKGSMTSGSREPESLRSHLTRTYLEVHVMLRAVIGPFHPTHFLQLLRSVFQRDWKTDP